jgi:lipoprotein-anchoring transpeptidase ErfK/SrfK
VGRIGRRFGAPLACFAADGAAHRRQTGVYLPGWVTVPLGQMYNPVFFIDHAYAIHGDTDVPLQPVSHGCMRIPMDIARFFHTMIVPGTPVYIRGN